ncbi:hypothetical protein [Variovorax sp. J31P207]|uniref:hypothetical protein n=1 Tax=Variovorax sp. J31P207 TaxID=3053510 RepID=UPI00257806A3|nr:hypothetical protein [Variovorax sp. J31P207]
MSEVESAEERHPDMAATSRRRVQTFKQQAELIQRGGAINERAAAPIPKAP